MKRFLNKFWEKSKSTRNPSDQAVPWYHPDNNELWGRLQKVASIPANAYIVEFGDLSGTEALQFCLGVVDGTYFRQNCRQPGWVPYAKVPWYQPESGLFWTSIDEVRISNRRTLIHIIRNSLPDGFWELARQRRQGMAAESQYYLMDNIELRQTLQKQCSSESEKQKYWDLCRPTYDFIEENREECLDLGTKFQVRRALQLLRQEESMKKTSDDDGPTSS